MTLTFAIKTDDKKKATPLLRSLDIHEEKNFKL